MDHYVTNLYPALITNNIRVSYSSAVYGSVCNVVIVINANVLANSCGKIVVAFPIQYGITGSSCAVSGGVTATCAIVNSTAVITVTAITISAATTISIANIRAPTYATTTSPLLTTYTSTNYLISQAQLTPWSALCTLPCKTCQSTTPTICLSCFSPTDIVPVTQHLYDTTNQQCVDQCSVSELTDTANKQCVPCTSPCLYCSISATNCTKCFPLYYLYNNICNTACPSLFYKNSYDNQCLRCVPPCQTCIS